MAIIRDLLVKNISETSSYARIVFRYPIISEHKEIVEILTGEGSKTEQLKSLVLERVTVTVGGYDTGDGFQYSIWGIGNPDTGKRSYIKGNEYPPTLEEGQMISELQFSFTGARKHAQSQARKFRMRFVNNFVEIHPNPSSSIVKEIISLLKESLLPNPRIFLCSAKEKLRSAKVDFLRGRYRSMIHNVYYAMFNAVSSLQATAEKWL